LCHRFSIFPMWSDMEEIRIVPFLFFSSIIYPMQERNLNSKWLERWQGETMSQTYRLTSNWTNVHRFQHWHYPMTASIVRNVKLAQEAPEGPTKLGKFKSKQEWNGVNIFWSGWKGQPAFPGPYPWQKILIMAWLSLFLSKSLYKLKHEIANKAPTQSEPSVHSAPSSIGASQRGCGGCAMPSFPTPFILGHFLWFWSKS
jgi:hypothetical protein